MLSWLCPSGFQDFLWDNEMTSGWHLSQRQVRRVSTSLWIQVSPVPGGKVKATHYHRIPQHWHSLEILKVHSCQPPRVRVPPPGQRPFQDRKAKRFLSVPILSVLQWGWVLSVGKCTLFPLPPFHSGAFLSPQQWPQIHTPSCFKLHDTHFGDPGTSQYNFIWICFLNKSPYLMAKKKNSNINHCVFTFQYFICDGKYYMPELALETTEILLYTVSWSIDGL